ncbi:MAG TPA: DNA helicase RecQ, partial [Cyanobacteria bacterium UBA11369]|nr:DNA helicase RecQ [Cyanobacteria bacterium UBA11369]
PKPVEDWTIEAMKFLSCVARCKEKFGINHIIDVLRGSRGQKVLQNKHDELSTYGIGKDKTAEEWKNLARSLLNQGLLEQTTDGYAVLKLNALSWEVMRRQRSVSIAIPKKETTTLAETNLKKAGFELLFDRLRQLRKQIADEHSVPPYVIFHDSTLKLMAQVQPQSLAEFGEISGVGARKLEQYGEIFLAEIQAYRQEQGLAVAKSTTPNTTQLITWEYYEQGLSIEEIAQKRNLQPSTIWGHLAELIGMGKIVDLDRIIDPERQQLIVKAIKEVGVTNALKPIYEYLDEKVNYGEIRLVISFMRQGIL